VKPENILLERLTGRAMVTDFGIAQRRDGRGAGSLGDVVGTAHFMSPEQAQGEPVDGRSDLYSLGVTAFYALAGRLPFDAPSLPALLGQHLTRPAPSLTEARPGLAPRLAAAVDRCLAKSPDARFASGEALAEEIGAIRSALPAVPPVIGRLQRSFQLVPLLGTACAIVMTWVTLMAPAGAAALGLLLLAVWGISVLDLLSHARLAQRAGFTPRDVAAAFRLDARQRTDEDAAGGRLLRVIGHPAVFAAALVLGIAGLLLGLTLPQLGIRSPHWRVKLAFVGTFLLVLILPVALNAPARASTWGRLWDGRVGKVWFGIAAVGLRRSSGR
jgi:serine/threonine-protein kinase